MSSRFESNVYQRDTSRTQLFGNTGLDTDKSSPYDNQGKLDYSQSTLAQLESQSEEQMGSMSQKIKALKSLSLRMGDEIRGSNGTLDQLDNTFQRTTTKLKQTYKDMMVMAKKSRISIKTWLAVFFFVFLLFFWVWIT
ncbi:Protein transport protein BET1 [Nakaseomyces bracarensis]|uniref:Protein transport protein BET1 n=1 Tax=Nakaseomyces bracarensis TaxID=273131 RepID=A0ABR4NWH6_9SACH